jgi:hypothetical protein
MEVSYGNEASQQTSEGDQRRLQAHSQRQALGTSAHPAKINYPELDAVRRSGGVKPLGQFVLSILADKPSAS